jgi:exodeoxyribonuclease V alpha subunit
MTLPIDLLFARKVFPDAPETALQFLAYLLRSAREGHLCVSLTDDLEPLLLEGAKLLPTSLFEEILVQKENRIYLRRNWECENVFLTHFQRLYQSCPSLKIGSLDMSQEGLNREQQLAIQQAAESCLTLISGGPGTGKTYTAAILIRLFLAAGIQKVAVAAPTGKASSNLRDALSRLQQSCEVKTLHALLKNTPLYAELIVVDEGSMIDAPLMAKLMSAVRTGARLVLLGDKNQLPPVESGHLFADLATNPHNTIELKTCLRAELQEIVDLGEAVKNGKMIPAGDLPEVKSFIKMVMENPSQVLTPLRNGPYGSDHLNHLLYLEHQRRGAETIPILIKVNDPLIGLYNGDTGLLIRKEGYALFSNGRKFPEYLLPAYEYAYALSVHKSQGSEYDQVTVILPKGSEVFGREMLYTAITRAKKKISLMAHPGILEKVVASHAYRQSGFNVIFNHIPDNLKKD